MEDKIGVALCKEACPLCGKEEDGPIILNEKLTKPAADKVKELHGKTIGYMDGPCSECKSLMVQGILLIGVIEELSDDPKNPYRSGHQWVVTEDFINRTTDTQLAADIIFARASFFSLEVAKQMGFPNTEDKPEVSPK